MSDSPDTSLFEGTATYYAMYRSGYPAELFDFLAKTFDLNSETRVIDLGSGTGQIAIPLGRRMIPVIAIEPDREMMYEGLKQADRLPVAWLGQRSDDLSELSTRGLLGGITLTTIGSAFHWMNREQVLEDLFSITSPGGGIAIVSSSESVWRETDDEPDWAPATREVIVEFLGPRRRAGGGTYKPPQITYQELVRQSQFSALEEHSFEFKRSLTPDDVIGLQLSTSYASPRLLGDRVEAFKKELGRRLRELAPSGSFETSQSCSLILARKP